MGLYKEVLGNTFEFWRQNLGKLILYQLLFIPLFLIGYLCLITFGITGLLFSFSLPMVGLALVGFLIIIIAGLLQGGGYPLILSQVEKEGRISIIKALKGSLKKIHKVFIVTLIVVIPIIIVSVIIAALAYFYISNVIYGFDKIYNFNNTDVWSEYKPMSISGAATTAMSSTWIIALIIVLIILLPVAIYIPIRLFFSIPILMIEQKGVRESVKISWKSTKGKYWVLINITFTIGIIAGIIQLILGAFPYVGTYIKEIVNYLLIAPLTGILSTVCYYTIKSKKSKEEK